VKPFLLALGALLIAGCAASPKNETTAGLICTKETPTGTHFPITKCRTQEQIEQERAEAARINDTIQRGQRQPPTQ
jgi:hypothetical protein